MAYFSSFTSGPCKGFSGSVHFHDNLAKDWGLKYRKASFRNRMKSFLSLLDGNDLNSQKWLDAGCGTGVLAQALAARGCGVIGVDASPGMIEAARSSISAQDHASAGRPVFEVVESIERLDFGHANFDGVVCSSVLEYVDDPNEAISQFYRILKPGGVLLISVPNKRSLLRNTQKLLHVVLKNCFKINWPAYLAFSRHSYTYESFEHLLRRNGFTVTSSTGYGPYMPNFISRVQFTSSIIMFLAKKEGL
jgi:2-polyprenyl-6-hydroxyphenyl methylase/3-demethylubiquinone-9 3-methyltransferase